MVYVGTSGWAYSLWKPEFYPSDLSSSRFLSFYSTRLNAVEVNYTFCGCHVLSRHMADRWLAQTPDNFLFAYRGPKPISHFHRYRLRNAESRVGEFGLALRPFQDRNRLGPVLFQLPRTFTIDPAALEDFLRIWPRGLRVSFEFRHPSWFTDATYEILRHHRAGLCLAERDEMATPGVLTAPFVYLRLRKSHHTTGALRQLRERIQRYAEGGGDVLAFFRQDNVEGPLCARELLRTVEWTRAA